MTTEMITLKLDDKFLGDIDMVVKKDRYHNRTEFIREALRDKLEEARYKKCLAELAHLRGASTKKTSSKEYEEIRRKAFQELSKRHR